MLFAYNEKKQLISVKHYSSEENYYCPDCGDKLIFKQGTIKIPHFAHRKRTNCEGLSEGETQEHLRLKQLFWISGRSQGEEWVLEKPIPELQQRPDLLQNRTAVEIQCSPLKISRLIQRFKGYSDGGYQDWWLLGPPLWPKRKWSILQKHFCSYSQENGFHLWLIDFKGIYLLSHIKKFNQHCYYTKRTFPFQSMPLLEINQIVSEDKTASWFNYQQIQVTKQFLAVKLASFDEGIKPLQKFLYQQSGHVLHLPEWMYQPSQFAFIYNEAYIIFRYLYSLNPEKPAAVINDFERFCIESKLSWHFPRIEKERILNGLLTETRQLILRQ
ncbi:competence protein CoiA [Enterococcus sp. AZ072]|uniref:competence protein CoiA n=1 Tax=unclassified Enterococcus TaxID=2608891 RepID=UPI003D2A3C64